VFHEFDPNESSASRLAKASKGLVSAETKLVVSATATYAISETLHIDEDVLNEHKETVNQVRATVAIVAKVHEAMSQGSEPAVTTGGTTQGIAWMSFAFLLTS
jgi:hypothetical protein